MVKALGAVSYKDVPSRQANFACETKCWQAAASCAADRHGIRALYAAALEARKND